MENKIIFYSSVAFCIFIGVFAKPARDFNEKLTEKENSAASREDQFASELHIYLERVVLVHRNKNTNDSIDECKLYGTRTVIKAMQSKYEDVTVTEYSNETVADFRLLLSECKATQKRNMKGYLTVFHKLKQTGQTDYMRMSLDSMTSGSSRDKRWIGDMWDHGLSGFPIYPGTNWCGAGNISDHYYDLGEESTEDACCRAHDHCPSIIEAGDTDEYTKLENDGLFTRCDCQCDKAFKQCLKNADSFTGWMIGNIFFDILNMKCFQYDYPWGCIDYSWFWGTCDEHGRDTEQSPRWHFTDELTY